MRTRGGVLVGMLVANLALGKTPAATVPTPKHAPAPAAAAAETPPGGVPGEEEFRSCAKYPADKRFKWGVRGEVTVDALVASLAEISCRTIVVSPQVEARSQKVRLEVPDLLTTAEIYRLFVSALEVLGLTIERTPHALKIVDAGRAKEVAELDTGAGPSRADGDQFVTRLIRIEHVSLAELADVLGKLKSKEGEITAYAPGSALIVTDRAQVVRRIEQLARTLDVQEPGARLWSLAVNGSSATELAATLDKVLAATRREAAPQAARPGQAQAAASGARPGSGQTLIPIDAARVLIVVAAEETYRQVAALAARIDPPLPEGAASQAHVIYLANTNAEEMGQTLSAVGLAGRSLAASPNRAGQFSGAAGTQAPMASSQAAVPLQGEVRIAPDKVANALVVFAGPQDFQMVRELVAKLDIPRRQVYVDCAILDLSVDKTRDLGLSWHGGDASSDGNTAGLVSSGGTSVSLADPKAAAALLGSGGLTAGILGKSFSIAGTSLPSFGVVLHALEHDKDVNVISRPHLLTMDNVKATLSVGQQIPFPVASTFAAALGQQTTYSRQPVALQLEITPHLNDSDSVRLEIKGEISDVPDGQAANSPGGPTTNQRTINTAAVVGDGETIVLGGLQKDSQSEIVDKIPFLGDLPILGRLFQTHSSQRTKQDLLVVLTPYVIRGPEDLRRIFERKEQERRDFIERYTAFKEDAAYDPHVDWRRKRGLLEEINRTAREAEREADAIHAAERSLRRPPPNGPIAAE